MWPPKKMNPALDALRQEVVQKIADVLRGEGGQEARTTEDVLILQAKRRRIDRLELPGAELLNEPVRSSTA